MWLSRVFLHLYHSKTRRVGYWVHLVHRGSQLQIQFTFKESLDFFPGHTRNLGSGINDFHNTSMAYQQKRVSSSSLFFFFFHTNYSLIAFGNVNPYYILHLESFISNQTGNYLFIPEVFSHYYVTHQIWLFR